MNKKCYLQHIPFKQCINMQLTQQTVRKKKAISFSYQQPQFLTYIDTKKTSKYTSYNISTNCSFRSRQMYYALGFSFFVIVTIVKVRLCFACISAVWGQKERKSQNELKIIEKKEQETLQKVSVSTTPASGAPSHHGHHFPFQV